MNCISASDKHLRSLRKVFAIHRAQSLLLLCLFSCAACGTPESEEATSSEPLRYSVRYTITPDPAAGAVDVTLEVSQEQYLFREARMRPDSSIVNLEGSGELVTSHDEIRWRPLQSGGSLSWRVHLRNRRNGDGYDAWLGSSWGLFRAEDIIPRFATRTLVGAVSATEMVFVLPHDWSVVTQYRGRNRQFEILNPERRFDQPTGWIVVGDIGVRRETIAGTRVSIAGPVGQAIRRMDMLALLNWTLPELTRVLPGLPDRLTIVSAGDPMWRGGLSAPQSLFIHADRPLISENATSTLLHEVMHLSLGLRSRPGFDWIIEGLAEFYSLELLGRSGTISRSRYETAHVRLAKWAESADLLCGSVSSGPTTALAVTILLALDKELRDTTENSASLDTVVSELWEHNDPLDLQTLNGIAEELTGRNPDALHGDNLPGCDSINAVD